MGCYDVTSPEAWNTIFASIAPTTQKSYRLIFNKFLKYMKTRDVNINRVSLAVIFDFLQPLVAARKAESTLCSYVASLKFFFTLFERRDLVESKLFEFFPRVHVVWRQFHNNPIGCGTRETRLK
jgi:hypothetical protein